MRIICSYIASSIPFEWSIWPIDGTLIGTTTPGLIGPESNGWDPYTPQDIRTVAAPCDADSKLYT